MAPALVLSVAALALGFSGCGADDRGESGAAASEEAAALPPGPISYQEPGTIANHTGQSYESVVGGLLTGGHPDAAFFWGTLPCASCPGIRTKLTLVPGERVYVLRQTYLEADEGRHATFTTVGSWTEEDGDFPDRPGVQLLRLEAGDGEPPVLQAARWSVDTLRILDRNGGWIESELPYDLVRLEH